MMLLYMMTMAGLVCGGDEEDNNGYYAPGFASGVLGNGV